MITAALAFLKALPWQIYAGLLLLGACGSAYAYVAHLKHEVASITAERDGLQLSIDKAKTLAKETTAAEQLAQKEISSEAQRMQTHASDDARLAVDSHQRLLQRATAVASTGQAASAPQGSQTATGPGLVLANVLSSVDEEAGQLADYADQARIAGYACERSYDAVK